MPGDDVGPPRKPRKRAPAKKTTAAAKLKSVPPPAEAEVFDPRFLAHQLRVQGQGWAAIAQATGYLDGRAAAVAVRRYLERAAIERSAEQRALALQIEVDRYEKTINSWWVKAMVELDPNAAGVVLRAMAQLDRLERFDDLDAATIGGRTIVIAGTPEQYVAKLQAVVAGQDPDEIDAI